MTPNYYLCDICNLKCPTNHRIYVVIGRVMDAAGSMDDEGKYVDICGDCCLNAFDFLYLHNGGKSSDFSNSKNFLNYVKERKIKNEK